MKTRLYLLLVPFVLVLIATGLFVYLALQNGQAIHWVAAGLNGLTAVLLLCGVVLTLRSKPPASDNSKEAQVASRARGRCEVKRRTSRCSRPGPHEGLSCYTVSSAAPAAERGRSATESEPWIVTPRHIPTRTVPRRPPLTMMVRR